MLRLNPDPLSEQAPAGLPLRTAHQLHNPGPSSAVPFANGGGGIAVGDDYRRAQQAPSAPHVLFNPRTGRVEPMQPPESAPRLQQLQQQQRQQQQQLGARGGVA